MGIVAKGGQQFQRQQQLGEGANPRPPHATGVVHHDAVGPDGEVVHHHQRFEQGELVDWQRDDEPGPWALVRDGSPFEPFPDRPVPSTKLERVQVRVGSQLHPLPLLDDLGSDRWAELPHVPDATARLFFELTGTPVGPVAVDIRYQDGRRPMAVVVDDLVETAEGEPAHGAPEMHIVMAYRNYLRMRAGELTALEAIEDGGTVDARWTLLLLLHGLLQDPVYVDIYRSLPEVPHELGWWGEVAPWVPQRSSF